jgi:hypothetical protein
MCFKVVPQVVPIYVLRGGYMGQTKQARGAYLQGGPPEMSQLVGHCGTNLALSGGEKCPRPWDSVGRAIRTFHTRYSVRV